MPSPATLALREQDKQLTPGRGTVIAHTGANREQRRHGSPPVAPLHAQPRKITIPKAARVPASNTPHVTRLAVLAPQLSRRDRRIASRDAATHPITTARAA